MTKEEKLNKTIDRLKTEKDKQLKDILALKEEQKIIEEVSDKKSEEMLEMALKLTELEKDYKEVLESLEETLGSADDLMSENEDMAEILEDVNKTNRVLINTLDLLTNND